MAAKIPPQSGTKLHAHLREARYSVRLLRYWWAGQALAAEARRAGRPLTVVDLGCERGWLRHFTPEGAVKKWIGLDWNPNPEARTLARYDEVRAANFDAELPLEAGAADAVVSLHVFEHLLRPGWTMAEASRILRPGGLFLGCTPTMPHWLAWRRERHMRRRWREGRIADGGHITCLSPRRWRSLAQETGMEVELLTGSHAIRKTGAFFENWKWWVRVNQAWGALFPSLGSECCLTARKEHALMTRPARLAPEDFHRRGLWISLGAAASLLMLGLTAWGGWHISQAGARRVEAWLNAHQTGEDLFLIHDEEIKELCGTRPDFQCVDSPAELDARMRENPDAHLLVSVPAAKKLTAGGADQVWSIDSRLDFHGTDYLLLRLGRPGTPLREYLLGTH